VFGGTPGSGDRVGGVILVFRTFLKLVWMSVQNLVEIGQANWALKEGHKYKLSI